MWLALVVINAFISGMHLVTFLETRHKRWLLLLAFNLFATLLSILGVCNVYP